MISRALAEKILTLLTQEKLSRRKVAKLTGVSRATVNAIANGEWFARYAGRHPEDAAPPKVARCPGCGALVEMPCRACTVKRLKEEGRLPPLPDTPPGPLRLELEGPAFARYLEVRAAALQRGEPDADPNWSPAEDSDDDWDLDDRFPPESHRDHRQSSPSESHRALMPSSPNRAPSGVDPAMKTDSVKKLLRAA